MMDDLQRELDAARAAVMAAEAEAEKWRARCIVSKIESVQAHRDAAQDMYALDLNDVQENDWRIEHSDSDSNVRVPINVNSDNLRQRSELLLQELAAKLTSTPTRNSILITRRTSSPARDVSASELIDTLRSHMRLMTEQQAEQEARADEAESQVRHLKNLLYAAESLVMQNDTAPYSAPESMARKEDDEQLRTSGTKETHKSHVHVDLFERTVSMTTFVLGIAAGLLLYTCRHD